MITWNWIAENNKHLLSNFDAAGQETRSSLDGWFWVRGSQDVALQLWVGCRHAKVRLGWENCPHVLVADLSSLTAAGQRFQFPSTVASPCACPQHGSTFPQKEWFERESKHQDRSHSLFYNLMSSLLPSIPYIADQPWYNRGGLHRGVNTRRHNGGLFPRDRLLQVTTYAFISPFYFKNSYCFSLIKSIIQANFRKIWKHRKI